MGTILEGPVSGFGESLCFEATSEQAEGAEDENLGGPLT